MSKQRYIRKIIKITAWDSPNVRYAQAQIERGLTPTDEIIIPGVLSWAELQKRLATFDIITQTVSLKAEFYEGAEVLLFPELWLTRSALLHAGLIANSTVRTAKSLGCDPAEGGDKTALAAVDEYGLLDLETHKTPDTSVVPNLVIKFAKKHGIPCERWMFDRGGGGKVHVDNLRAMGYKGVKTVGFGESVSQEPRKGRKRIQFKEQVDQKETRYAYFNRRSEMYGMLSTLMDPAGALLGKDQADYFAPDIQLQIGISPSHSYRGYRGFAIPPASQGPQYEELRRQLGLIPKKYEEGRLKLPPKNKKRRDSNEVTLADILGCSPDESDALVLAVYGLVYEIKRIVVGGKPSSPDVPNYSYGGFR